MSKLILPSYMSYQEPKEKFLKLIGGDFAFDLTDRVSLVADVNHFKIKEDESVWEQAKGDRPNYIEVYWDGVWVCDFTEKEKTEVVRVRFLKAFVKLYEENKVGLNTPKDIENDKAQKTIDDTLKELKKQKPKNEEESIIKDVQVGLLEDKKAPKKKKLSDLVL